MFNLIKVYLLMGKKKSSPCMERTLYFYVICFSNFRIGNKYIKCEFNINLLLKKINFYPIKERLLVY